MAYGDNQPMGMLSPFDPSGALDPYGYQGGEFQQNRGQLKEDNYSQPSANSYSQVPDDQQMMDPQNAAWGAALMNIGDIAGRRAPSNNIVGSYMAAKAQNDKIRQNRAAQSRQAEQDALNERYVNSQIAKNEQGVSPWEFKQIAKGQWGYVNNQTQEVKPIGQEGMPPAQMDPESIKLERDARKDYSKTFGAFQDQVLNNQKLESSLMQGSGAGDYAAVISFVKSLDPTSVVREGEAAMASDVAGIYEKLQMLRAKAEEGETLSPEVKADYLNLSREWLSHVAKAQQQKAVDTAYRAERYGYDARAVMGNEFDYTPFVSPQMVDSSYFGVAPPAQDVPPPLPRVSPADARGQMADSIMNGLNSALDRF